jgi:choline kinase
MYLALLAAGRGTRLPKKYRSKPKCLVEINKKTILSHNLNFYNKFKNRIIISGYKSKKLDDFIKYNNFFSIKNKDYAKTNMVHSLFKINKINEKEIVVCYTDIIFDPLIYFNLKKTKNKNIILLKKNWLDVWRGRMKQKEILKDAEQVFIKRNLLISIGGKIENKLPNYQYMGIMKFKTIDFFKLKDFYKKINNQRIDLTSFINLALKNRIIKFNISTTSKYWFELDNLKDIKYTEKQIT